jgi:hypothetical protein
MYPKTLNKANSKPGAHVHAVCGRPDSRGGLMGKKQFKSHRQKLGKKALELTARIQREQRQRDRRLQVRDQIPDASERRGASPLRKNAPVPVEGWP